MGDDSDESGEGIGATFGVGSLDSGTSEVDTTSYGVNAEWQLSSMPVSLLAGYTHWELDDVPVESEAFTIGARALWRSAISWVTSPREE